MQRSICIFLMCVKRPSSWAPLFGFAHGFPNKIICLAATSVSLSLALSGSFLGTPCASKSNSFLHMKLVFIYRLALTRYLALRKVFLFFCPVSRQQQYLKGTEELPCAQVAADRTVLRCGELYFSTSRRSNLCLGRSVEGQTGGRIVYKYIFRIRWLNYRDGRLRQWVYRIFESRGVQAFYIEGCIVYWRTKDQWSMQSNIQTF